MEYRLAQRAGLANIPTPIQELRRLSAMLGGPRLLIKRDDFTGVECSGNKVRKLDFIAARALQEGCTTLITCGGLQSNHARATAAVAARLGLVAHLVLAGAAAGVPSGNHLLDLLLGARCTYVPGAELDELQERMVEIAADYERAGEKAMIIPLGASDAVGANGYVHAVQEMSRQFEDLDLVPDYIVVPSGSGGTQAGLILGKVIYGLPSEVLGINVRCDESYFIRQIGRIIREFCDLYGCAVTTEPRDIRIVDGYVGGGYGRSTPELLGFITRFARMEGILLDPTYTGKAFFGLVQEIEKGRFRRNDTILFIHTGGIFGVFPAASEFIPHFSDAAG